MALNETQPDALPTRLASAFTPGWEDGINFLLQCQLGRGVTSNFAEYYIEPLKKIQETVTQSHLSSHF